MVQVLFAVIFVYLRLVGVGFSLVVVFSCVVICGV